MVDHAFTSLGLHRVALSVFAFNERAIRAYQRVGFTIEGRAREAIWRDGRWWDELHMSVLEPEWRAARWQASGATAEDGRGGAEVRPTGAADGRPRRDPTRPRARGADAMAASEGPPPTPRGRRSASGWRRRATPSRTRGWPSTGWRRPSPPVPSSGRRRSTAMLARPAVALEQDEGQKLGGKSAEAARFILRAIDRELDNA